MLRSSNIALSGAPRIHALEGGKSYASARNPNIQYLRAVAAGSVLLHHAFIADGRFGVYGVSLFFAISGYLMSGLVHSTEPWRFLAHRVLRIYPIYFLAIGFGFILSHAAGSPFAFDLLGMTLAPVGPRAYSLGGIEWTLVFEVTYYIALFLLAWAKFQRYLEVIAITWVGVIIGTAIFFPSFDGLYLPIHLLLLAPANLAFAGGLLLPFLISRGYLPRASALIVVPALLAYDFLDLGSNRILSGLASVCVVGWAAQSRAPRNRRLNRPLLLLGDWSYALYLCHVPIIHAVIQLLPTSFERMHPEWFAVSAALLFVLLFGPLDLALYRWLRTLSDAARPQTNRIALSVFLVAFLSLSAYGSTVYIVDEIQNRRIQNTLNQLGASAFVTPEIAAARIPAAQLSFPSSLQGAFERVDALPGGGIVFRGWALSDHAPSKDLKFRVFCGGRELGINRTHRRMRSDIAKLIGREDMMHQRFGFALFASPQECPNGSQVFVIAFDKSGRAAVLPGRHGLSE